jgi:hypothetical protein
MEDQSYVMSPPSGPEHCFGELSLLYLTTKIITLSEFFNFVCEVSRLQYK